MAYNFPDAPTLGQAFQGWLWDGEKWVSSGIVSTPPGNAKKNYIINGAMQVSQENGTTTGPATVAGFFAADQFSVSLSGSSGAAWGGQISASTPGGSTNRIRVQATTADAAVAAADYVLVQQSLEGVRAADLVFGAANAKTVTVQFGVKAPAGTYSLILINPTVNRSYVAEYVIAAGEANTDVARSITFPGDTLGTWPKDNTAGIIVRWGLMAGSTFQQAAGSWGTGNAIGSPNQFNFMGTVNNVFELFDVSLTEGTTAPPFQVPDYARELALCQRYYRKLGGQVASDMYNAGYGTASGAAAFTVPFNPPMRAAPTIAAFGTFGNVNVANSSYSTSASCFSWAIQPAAVGQMHYYSNIGGFALNARL